MATPYPNRGIPKRSYQGYPSPQERFTDRENFRELLRKAVETPQTVNEYRVKVIYGAGGQGKSALKEDYFFATYLRKLRLEYQKLIVADVLDWEKHVQTRQADKGLLRIAEALINQGVPMPAFCLGFIRYQMLLAPGSNLQNIYPFLFKAHLAGKGVTDTLTDQLFATITGSLADVMAQSVPVIGYFAKQATNSARQKLVDWLRRKQVKEILGDLDELSRAKLLERLPELLAYDVSEYLCSGMTPPAEYPSKRIIITVDGYEGIWNNDMVHNAERDAWMRRLVECLPGVLFVFFGRDRLRWADNQQNAAYDDILDQHLLQGLSDEDANYFLQQVGISETDIRLKIVRGAKDADNPDDGCLPFYLDLQARQYHDMLANGKVPAAADFANNSYQSVVNHFYEHLPPPIASALKQLSLANYVDEELLDLFRAHPFTISDAVTLPALRQYSFFKEKGDVLTMHGLMREMSQHIVTAEFGPRRAQLIQQMLFEHFEAKVKAASPAEEQALTALAETHLEQAAYHKQRADPAGYVAWVLSQARHFYGQDVHGALLSALKTGYHLLAEQKRASLDRAELSLSDFADEELAQLAELNYWLAQRYYWGDNYALALRRVRQCIECLAVALPPAVRTELRGQYAAGQPLPVDARHLLQLAVLASSTQANIRCYQDRYVEAGQDYNEAKTLASDFNLEFDEYSLHTYYALIGRFGEAEPYLFASYTHYQQPPPNAAEAASHHLTRANIAITLGRALRQQQRFDEALRFYEEAYALYSEHRGQQHADTYDVLQRLATTLIAQGTDLSRASAIAQQLYEAYDKLYPSHHINMGWLASIRASLAFKLGRAEEAYRYHQHATKILGERLGSECQPVLRALVEQGLMGQQLARRGQQPNAFEHAPMILAQVLRKKYHMFKNAFTIFSPVLHEGLTLAAEVLAAQGQAAEAAQMAATQVEYTRIARSRTAIRTGHFSQQALAPAERPALLALAASVLSLPVDQAQVSIQKIQLPFYAGWYLYELHYHNTPQAVRRYLLSDEARAHCLNYKNAPIYSVSEQALQLTEANAAEYAAFFFDACCGRHGFFHLITNPRDLPWQADVVVPEAFRQALMADLHPIQLVEKTETHYILRSIMVFQNALLDAYIHVTHHGPERGQLAIMNERQLVARPDGHLVVRNQAADGSISYTTLSDEPVQLAPNEALLEQLPMCIDPDYRLPPLPSPAQSTGDQLKQVFTLGSDMLELLLSLEPVAERPQHPRALLLARMQSLLAAMAAGADLKISELSQALQGLSKFLESALQEIPFDKDDFRYQYIEANWQTTVALFKEVQSISQN